MFKLYDYISVDPGKKISSLKDEEKKELMDSITSKRKKQRKVYLLLMICLIQEDELIIEFTVQRDNKKAL